jgi:hypothetical protein
MSRTVWPWPDIITTIARRSRTGSLELRLIFWILRPSSIDSGRTNTLGRRATSTSRTRRAGSVDPERAGEPLRARVDGGFATPRYVL